VKLQTVGHTSTRHTLEETGDGAALGILPVSPDAVERRYPYARHSADSPRSSLGPTRRDPDDQVLPHRGERSTRSCGVVSSDLPTLRRIATMTQLADRVTR
jgi:hypothetical protein